MEKEIRNVLKKFFDKYEVPNSAIESAVTEILRLAAGGPPKQKYGAVVMTEEASMAADQKLGGGRQKPPIV